MKRLAGCYIWVLAVALFCIFSAALQAQVNVTTYHNDNARTGQNTQETILTTANVNSSQFGKLFSVSVDGWVYAQPLYLSNVNIGGGTHNVLYVATEHDSLYAIEADTGTIYWQVSLIASGGTTVNSSTDLGCGDLVPEVGITGTPVIDTNSGTIYLVATSKVNGSIVQYLHAIDVVTKAEKFGGPMLIQATVPGTASDGNGTTVSFSPHLENQRAGLLLENGHVVIGWSSHCDISPWHGWIMSYSASTLAQEAAFNTSADGSANGVWMSGGGLAADSSGNIFFATGNGTWNGTTDYSDSIVKLGPPSRGSFPVIDYFTPYNQSSLSGGDTDVASGGLVLLPDLASGQQLLTQMGEEGTMYLVDRNNMGKYCVNETPPCNGSDTNIVQEIPGATVGVWGTPAYWNGSVYWGGGNDDGGPDNLKAFSFNANNNGLISTSPTSESAKQFSFAAPSPIISANGNTNGIVWGLDDSAFGSSCSSGSNCQVLYAYDATNLANMLYNSSQAANNRDVPGGAVKFATPIVANGKVYVGSQLKVSAYGVTNTTPTAATPTFSPAPGSYTTNTNVTLSDSTSGATIHCTTDGSTPTAGSPLCSSIAISSTTTLKAIATASGYNPSAIASGIYTTDPGATAINYGARFTSTGIILNGIVEPNGTGNGQVRLSWSASTGATSYNVKRSTTSGGPYTTIASPTTTSYTDTGVTNGTTYYYVVSAVNTAGESANSSQVSATPQLTAPPPPTNLVATAGNGQVGLSWSASSGATSYNVKRSTISGGPYTTIASPTTTSYTDTGVTNGTTYYYVVSAVNTAGQSANSSQVSATPGGTIGSWSVVHHTSFDRPCSNTVSCTLSPIPSVGPGHVLVIMVSTFDIGAAVTYSSVTGGGGSWINDTKCYASFKAGSDYLNNFCIYNLSPMSGTTSLKVNLSSSAKSYLTWGVDVWELAWSGSTVSYDTGGTANDNTCSGTLCTGVSLTLSGSKDVIIQSANPNNNNITAISGGAGYTSYEDFLGSFGSGFATAINTTTAAAPTWIDSGSADQVAVSAIALKGN